MRQELCPSPCLRRSYRDGVALQSLPPSPSTHRSQGGNTEPTLPSIPRAGSPPSPIPNNKFCCSSGKGKRKKKIGKSYPSAATQWARSHAGAGWKGGRGLGGPGGTAARGTLLSSHSTDPSPAPLPCQAVAALIISAISYSRGTANGGAGEGGTSPESTRQHGCAGRGTRNQAASLQNLHERRIIQI